jgi:hypothetical protein
MMDLTTLAVVAVLGWILAGFGWGLWWGERGRRLDLAWFVGAMVPKNRPVPEPQVERMVGEEEEVVSQIERDALAGNIYREAAEKGQPITESEAEAEAARLLLELEKVGELS